MKFAQWAVVESVNMAIELLIPCLIIAMVWSLHMPLGTKITVVLAFSLQLLYAILLVQCYMIFENSQYPIP